MKAQGRTHVAALGMAALALLAGGMQPAKAQTITLNAVDSGWYDEFGRHTPANQNYLAGRSFVFGIGGTLVFNNFFVFDLPAFAQPIASAELRIFNPTNGYFSLDPTEIYTLFDVSTPISALVAGGTGRTDIFADLGSGVPYGSQVVSAEDNGRIVTIGLNAAGVTALSGASGLFALGGTLTTLSPGGPLIERVFGFTSEASQRQLVVTLIPEPGTLALFSTSALGLLGCGWRRRRQAA